MLDDNLCVGMESKEETINGCQRQICLCGDKEGHCSRRYWQSAISTRWENNFQH